MSDQQIIDILQNFDGILIQNDWFSTFIRWLGWWIIKGLASLVNSVEGIIGDITGLTGFFDSPEITNLINSLKPVIFALLALSLAFVAYLIFFNKKFDKSSVPTNILLATMVIILLPVGMVKLNELTQTGINAVYGDFNSMAYEIIDNNVTDVYLYDENNFSSKEVSPKNNVPREQIHKVDINEPIDKTKTKHEKVFENEVMYKKDGGYELDRIDGFFKWDNQYYRWKCNFWIIIVSLFATGATLILTSIKITRLLYELAFNKVFAIILAYVDIASGQRLKKVIQNIISIFAVLFCMALMLKIYLIFSAWIGSKDLGLVGIFAIVGVSIAVIDGPNIVEQIFGIDAGLSSAWKTVAGMYAATRMGSELAKGVTKAGTGLAKFMSSTGGSIASGVAGGIGFGSGMKEGLKNNKLENQMNSDKDKTKKDGKPNSLENEMKKEGYDTKNNPLEDNKPNSGNNLEQNKGQNLDTNSNEGKNNLKSNKLNGEKDKNNDLENAMQSSGIGGVASDNDSIKSGINDSSTPGQLDNLNNDYDTNRNEDISGNSNGLSQISNLETGDLSEGLNSSDTLSRNGENTNVGSIDNGSVNSSNSLSNDSNSVSNNNDGIGISNKGIDSRGIIENGTGSISTEGIGSNNSNLASNNSDGIGISNKGIDNSDMNKEKSGNINSQETTSSSIDPIRSEASSGSVSSDNNLVSNSNIGSDISGIRHGDLGSNSNVSSDTSNRSIDSGSIGSSSSGGVNSNASTNTFREPIKTESVGNISSNSDKSNTQSIEGNEKSKNNVIESRVFSDVVKEKVNSSSIGNMTTKVKRSYQIGKNTGEKFGENRSKKKGRKDK